jgi:Fur family zinc uptake transcriptional regulator
MGRRQAQAERSQDAMLAAAVRYLSERGAQLTPIRRTVLLLLSRESKAVGAYDLAFRFEQEVGRRVAPNTIYRALDFLVTHRLAAHLPSKHSYVATLLQHDPSISTVFFTCTECGSFTERNETGVERAVRVAANVIGFIVAKRAIEVAGTCAQCASPQISRSKTLSSSKARLA